MTREHLDCLISTHGYKASLVLKLTDGSEMVLRGNIFNVAQQDLFRDRIRFSAPWTECHIDLKDIDKAYHDGKRTCILMRTSAITWFPRQ